MIFINHYSGKCKMESIYKYICKNIQNNGKLKDGFNLDIYNNSNGELKFAPGALDGINYYHSKIETDEELVKYIVEKIPVPALFKPIISLLLSSFIDDAIELAVEYMKNEVL